MKKQVSVILAAALAAASLVGCGGAKKEEGEQNTWRQKQNFSQRNK